MLHAVAAQQLQSMGRRVGVKSREVPERCGGGLQIADILRLKITVPYFIKGYQSTTRATVCMLQYTWTTNSNTRELQKGRAEGTGIEVLQEKGDKEKALMLHAAAAKQPRSMGR